jgi:hypothetical protein
MARTRRSLGCAERLLEKADCHPDVNLKPIPKTRRNPHKRIACAALVGGLRALPKCIDFDTFNV